MKLCCVVDYRSSIAQNWSAHFLRQKQEVHGWGRKKLTEFGLLTPEQG
jgi:hypothetical protein